MTKLETLYRSIEGLKELGLPLNAETLEAVDALEEELIKNEVVPRLSESIEPIVTKIQRPIVLVVDYVPGEDLSVRLTRKRVVTEDAATKMFSIVSKENEKESKTNTKRKSHTKQPGKGLMVKFPDGRIISNRFAYETMMEAIEVIGVEKVKTLGLKDVGIDLISKEKDDFYNQHQTKDGYFVVTHSSTKRKMTILKEISKRLDLNLKIEIV